MRAAEDLALLLHAMTDHATSAVLAGGRQSVNRTFEAVVGAGDAVEADLHRLRVFASTDCAACHGGFLLRPRGITGPASRQGCNARARRDAPMSGGSVPASGDAVACRLRCPSVGGEASHAPNSWIAERAVSRRTASDPDAWAGSPDGTHARSRGGGSRVRSA